MTLRSDLLAAIARGVEVDSAIASYAALRGLDPLLRLRARRRLRKLLQRAHSATIDERPAHCLRIAALLLDQPASELDFDDRPAVLQAYAALGPPPLPRKQRPWFTLGSIVALAVLGTAVALVGRALRPFDPRLTDAGQILGNDLATFVVKTSRGATGSALAESRARLTGQIAERALGIDTVIALEGLLDAAGWVAQGQDLTESSPEVERLHNDGNRLAATLNKQHSPYFVDVDTLRTAERVAPLLMSFYVERESEYRAGSQRVRALALWRLDTLAVRFGALGYTRPRTPAALVLLDQIESDLVRSVLPALAPGEPAQLVDDETREQGLPWVKAIEREAGAAVRRHYAALGGDPHVIEVGTLLAKRRALIRRWRTTLDNGTRQLRVPERLIPESDYSSDLHLHVPNSDLYDWDDLHQDLLSKANQAAFLRLRDPYVLGIERHEVEHRLDFARGFRPVPSLLCRIMGLENPLDAPVGSMQERVSAEFSAYLAQLADTPDSPVLELIVLSTHLLDAHSGGVYWYAALGVLEAVASELGLDPDRIVGQGRLDRERIATLLTQMITRTPSELRTAASHAYEKAYGEPVPHATKTATRDNKPWRH